MSAMTDRFNSNEDPAIIERDTALEYVQERLEDLHTENLKAIRAVLENPSLVLVATTPRIAGLMKITRWPSDAEFVEMNKAAEVLNELSDELKESQ